MFCLFLVTVVNCFYFLYLDVFGEFSLFLLNCEEMHMYSGVLTHILTAE